MNDAYAMIEKAPPLLPQVAVLRRLAFLLMFLAPTLTGLAALVLGQDANWDLRNYHWYNAYAFLNGRHGFDLLPSQTPFFYNPTLDVPFYLIATHMPARVAGFYLGFVQGLNFIPLFLIAWMVLRDLPGRARLAAAAGLGALGLWGGGGVAQIGTVFGDNIVSLGVLTSLALTLWRHQELMASPPKRAFPLAFLCGIPAGLAMGLKLTIAIYCVGLCAGFLMLPAGKIRRVALGFFFGLGVISGLLATQGHWMAFLWNHYQNPFFPYFNQFFGSPFAPPASARDPQFLPKDWLGFLALPLDFVANPRLVGEVSWRDWRVPILYLLLPLSLLALVWGKMRGYHDPRPVFNRALARYTLAFGAASYAAWLATFCIYRYLVPLEMVAPVLITLAIGLWPVRARIKAGAAILVLTVIAATVQPGNWLRLDHWTDRYMEVAVPPIQDPSRTMLLMAGYEPYAHVIPAFPPEMPVIRVGSNFATVGEPKGINRLVMDRVKGHQGDYLLVIPRWQVSLANETLKRLDLFARAETCVDLGDALYEPPMLCHVMRKETQRAKTNIIKENSQGAKTNG